MFLVKKIDEDKQTVFGEVYVPNVIDTHGDFMRAEDIELMAHRFMQKASLGKSIDTDHNNESADAYPIESFIAGPGNPDYMEGAWVLGVKIEDAALWQSVKKGDFNGFSFEAWVTKTPVVVELQVEPEAIGETEESEGHTHLFFAKVDDDGKVWHGRTSTVNGHSHEIKKASATEVTEEHSHRIFV